MFTGLFILAFGTFIRNHAALQCYHYSGNVQTNITQPGDLPLDKATIETCPHGETMCMKVYVSIKNNATFATYFQWGCGLQGKFLSAGLKCGDRLETGIGTRYRNEADEDILVHYYTRACVCCGDLCNSADAMDTECNDEPIFTHHCFSANRPNSIDPALPDSSVIIPCTSSQSCMKYSNYVNFNDTSSSSYQWGCISTPWNSKLASYALSSSTAAPQVPPFKCKNLTLAKVIKNGTSLEKRIEKACTCCTTLCNHGYDSIAANDTDCGFRHYPQEVLLSTIQLVNDSTGIGGTVSPFPLASSLAMTSPNAPRLFNNQFLFTDTRDSWMMASVFLSCLLLALAFLLVCTIIFIIRLRAQLANQRSRR